MSILQAVAEVTQVAVDQYHVIQGLGWTGILTAGLGVVRYVHKGQLDTAVQFGKIHEAVGTLKQEVKDHIKGAPTLVTCAEQALHIKKLIDTKDGKLRDEMTALVIDRDAKVDGLIRREAKRWGQNGVT